MYKLVIKDDESNKTVIAFYRQEITIGREEGNTIRLTEQNVSRKHAELTKSNNMIFLEDSNSYVGTFLNGETIDERKQLNNGDEIKIGDYLITVINENEDNEETVLVKDSSDNNQNDKKIKPVPVSEITGKKSENADNLSKDLGVSYPLKPPYNKIVFQDTNLAGTSFDILKSTMTIGKGPETDIMITNKSFADIEAKIICNENSVKIKDISNKGKLKVNGDPYTILELREGDVISIGSVSFRYCDKRSTYIYKDKASSGGNKKIIAIIGVLVVLAIVAVLAMNMGGEETKVKDKKNKITKKSENKEDKENKKIVDNKIENNPSESLSPALLNLMQSGKQLIKNKNWEKAEEVYKSILKEAPNNKDAKEKLKIIKKELENKKTYRKAINLFSTKKYQESIDTFKKIPEGTKYRNEYENKRKKDYYNELTAISDAYLKKKNYNKAREILSVANEIIPNTDFVIKGIQYIDKKTNSKVRTPRKRARRVKNTNRAISLTNEAMKLMMGGKPATALKKVKEAIRADSSYAPQYLTAAIASKKLNQKKSAIRYYRIYLKLAPRAGNAASIRKKVKDLENSL